MFWYGPDRIDGIFFDTGSTRGPINYSQEEEDRDISSHTMLATYAKNLYRDHVLQSLKIPGGHIPWNFSDYSHEQNLNFNTFALHSLDKINFVKSDKTNSFLIYF